MKPKLYVLFVSLVAAGLVGGVYRSWQRERLFAEHGTARTVTVVERESSRLVALFPPRFAHTYQGRIENVDARIETARGLSPGQTVTIRHLSVDTTAPLARLGGRTDRIVARRPSAEAVWFAYGSPDSSFAANLVADTPLPEGLFTLACALALAAAFAGVFKSAKKRPARAPRDLAHPVLRPSETAEPTPGPASARVVMPDRPPPLPQRVAEESAATLSLPRRPPTPRD